MPNCFQQYQTFNSADLQAIQVPTEQCTAAGAVGVQALIACSWLLAEMHLPAGCPRAS